jgi:hypothetical protein
MQPLSPPMAPALHAPRMSALHLIDAHETDLEHGYKELSIPADSARTPSPWLPMRCTFGRAAIIC